MKLDPTKRDCRRALCRLYNLGLADKIPASRAARLAYIVAIVLKSLENDEARWASADGSQPDPAVFARQIREAMRAADDLIPPPPAAE